MSLVNVYQKNFGGTAEEKTAETVTDEQIEEALSKMSEAEMTQLAAEVAKDAAEEKAEKTADSEKEAEELFAGGRILARGFLHEIGDGGETKSASEKFAELLAKTGKK